MERLTEKIKKHTGEVLAYRAKCRKDVETVQKLGRLEDLEEQGRLLKLPCKIGHKVYEIYRFCGYGEWEIEEHKIRLEDLDKIRKTVFLTREEAEAALKELENKEARK